MSSGSVIASLGFTVLIVGGVLANVAVKKMAKVLRRHWEVGYKKDAASRRNKETIRLYREAHVNGSLHRDLKIAWLICGIGFALLLIGAYVSSKF